ncbi:MAG: hypothetical protein RBT51_10545 [Ectothiorhodospiraceae bacterium]|nr:hypothetical protein [Ectothiorhodospiraceae bacterium]
MRCWLRNLMWCAMLGLAGMPAFALERVTLSVGELRGPDWQLRAVALDVTVAADDALGLSLRAVAVELPGGAGNIETLELNCPTLVVGDGLACADAHLRLDYPGVDAAPIPFEFAMTGLRDLRFAMPPFGIADGTLALAAAGHPDRIEATATLRHLRPDALTGGLAAMLADSGISAAGPVDAGVTAVLGFDGGRSLRLDATTPGLDFSDASGLRAAEKLVFDLGVQATQAAGVWRLESRLRLRGGALYVDPVFLEVPAAGITLETVARWDEARRDLRVDRLRLRHPEVLDAQLSAAMTVDPAAPADAVLHTATVKVDDGRLAGLYGSYLQPFLIGSALDDLEAVGRLSAELRLEGGQPSALRVALNEVYMDDRKGRFGLYGMNADLDWQRRGADTHSTLRWQGGHVHRITLGATEMRLDGRGDVMRLAEETRLPVLDGALLLHELEVTGLPSGPMRMHFDGSLTPLGMEALTTALGWPVMSGTLAGVIPAVSYADGVLTVGGKLLVRAFDGVLTVGGLRMEDPFGVPVLAADVELKGLDLEAVTRTFEFGRIEGRMDGHIRDLLLVGWQPARFEAWFGTPEGDRSRRRISQRAVDNLTSVGGGVGGALSTGFLRFFEDFSYGQLGLSCRLVGDVCEMDGVAPAGNGYYIVQGAGLPRIDVVGFTRQVAWKDLVNRLKNIRLDETGGPVIQ